jgi:hypothetical protein
MHLTSRNDATEGGWVFPSTVDTSTLPTIGLGVGVEGTGAGEQIFYIHPADLAYSPASPGYVPKHPTDVRWIYGGIQSKGSMTEDIFGDVFLKNVYAVSRLTVVRYLRGVGL